MNFNQCIRCGCFFTANDAVCPNCSPKDHLDLSKLKGYLEENPGVDTSLQDISLHTGIAMKNLSRYMANPELKNIPFDFNGSNGNMSTQL